MLRDKQDDCEDIKITGVHAREILFPVLKPEKCLEITLSGRNFYNGAMPVKIRFGRQALRNVEIVSSTLIKGILKTIPGKIEEIRIDIEGKTVARFRSLNPGEIVRLEEG